MIPELDNISDGEIVLLIVDVDKYHKAVVDIVNFFVMKRRARVCLFQLAGRMRG